MMIIVIIVLIVASDGLVVISIATVGVFMIAAEGDE